MTPKIRKSGLGYPGSQEFSPQPGTAPVVSGSAIGSAAVDIEGFIEGLTRGVISNSNTVTHLPPSHPGCSIPDLAKVAFTYDIGLTLMLLMEGHNSLAQGMVDYLWTQYRRDVSDLWDSADQSSGVNGFIRILTVNGQQVKCIVNGINTSARNEGVVDWWVDAGPHAWLGTGMLYLNPEKNFEFARQIGEFILTLQDTDGGIRAGPRTVAGTDREQTKRFTKKHTEHNISTYVFFKKLEAVARAQGRNDVAEKFRRARERIVQWMINRSYGPDPDGNPYFYQGVWSGVQNTIPNEPFATDANTWPAAFALEDISIERAEAAVKSVEKHSLVKIKYHRSDGRVVDVIGVDFSDPNQDLIKDERDGYHPMVSPEWTGGMILAYYRLAAGFWENGDREKATQYKAKGDALLRSIIGMATTEGGIVYLPYASAQWVEVGHGWGTPPGARTNLASSFVALAQMRFFPSEPDGGGSIRRTLDQIPATESGNALTQLENAVGHPLYEEQNQPPTQQIDEEQAGGWQAFQYTTEAWNALNAGNNNVAITWAKKVLDNNTWRELAVRQQEIKRQRGGIYVWPWGQSREQDEQGWTIIETHNWAVNHFAVAHWVSATAYMRLGNRPQSKEHLKQLLRNYNLAQIWSPAESSGPGFWNPIDSLMGNNARELQDIWDEVRRDLLNEGITIERPNQVPIPGSGTNVNNPPSQEPDGGSRVPPAVGQPATRGEPAALPEQPRAQEQPRTSGGETLTNRGTPWGGSSDYVYYYDLRPPRDFSGYSTIRFTMPTSFAGQNVIIQLLPNQANYGAYTNTVTERVPANGILEIPLSSFSVTNNIKQISFHSGTHPWGENLNSGMIQWTRVELIRSRHTQLFEPPNAFPRNTFASILPNAIGQWFSTLNSQANEHAKIVWPILLSLLLSLGIIHYFIKDSPTHREQQFTILGRILYRTIFVFFIISRIIFTTVRLPFLLASLIIEKLVLRYDESQNPYPHIQILDQKRQTQTPATLLVPLAALTALGCQMPGRTPQAVVPPSYMDYTGQSRAPEGPGREPITVIVDQIHPPDSSGYGELGWWEVADDDHFEITVEGTGEYIFYLTGVEGINQPSDSPQMFSPILQMGRTYRIRFGDLFGGRENVIMEIGISAYPNPWPGLLPSHGGAISTITIKLIKGGSGQKQLIGPARTGSARDGISPRRSSRSQRVEMNPAAARRFIPRNSRPRTKAWVGNELENAGEIANKLLHFSKENKGKYVFSNVYFDTTFTIDNITYKVTHDPQLSYFAVIITKDGITTEKKVFAMPLADGKILVPYKLYTLLTGLTGKESVTEQLSSHEGFEQMPPSNRIKLLNTVYSSFENPVDKEDFVKLWRRMGIELVLGEGKITGIKPLTKEAESMLGHIGGEIMELVDEYHSGKQTSKYKRFSDVFLSSLDATLLGIRLGEILGKDILSDDFVEKLTIPNNTNQIVLGLTDKGGINLELVERASLAVQSVGRDIPSYQDWRTKATLVLANEWHWQEREMKELNDILGKDLFSKLFTGLKKDDYECARNNLCGLLILIRKELGRIAQFENSKIKLSNPYLHTVIAKIANMAGIEPKVLLSAFYNDLIEAQNTAQMQKQRLVNAAVENALVEVGIVNKKGLINYESDIDPIIVNRVYHIAFLIYEQGLPTNVKDLFDPIDSAMSIDKTKDPFRIIEDLLLSSPFAGKLSCSMVAGSGVIPLIELIDMNRKAQRTAYSVPKDTETKPQFNTLVISLEYLFTIEKVDSENSTLTLQPKALGIAGKISQMLNSGRSIKIVGNPKLLELIPEDRRNDTIKEAVEKYLGLKLGQFPALSVEVLDLSNIIANLQNPNNSAVITTETEAKGLKDNRSAFVYVPQAGELLGDVITVVTSVSLNQDGKFTDGAKAIFIDYLKKQIPGIDKKTEIWQKVTESIENFNNGQTLFFTLPTIVKFTEILTELQFYRITVLIAA